MTRKRGERQRLDDDGHRTIPKRRLDEVLRNEKLFETDSFACSLAADRLKHCAWSVPPTSQAVQMEQSYTALLAICAISHQFNWDFLRNALFTRIASCGRPAELLAAVSASTLGAWLAEYPRPERIRARERAALLRDIGRILIKDFEGQSVHVLQRACGKLRGSSGLLAQLDKFEAFRQDPLRKKSNVFVHELVRSRLATFTDEDTIDPAIDYHIMRLYLRSDRVVPRHPEVVEVLRRHLPTRGRVVRILRVAVADALRTTAYYAGLSIPDVNYLEWHLGRAVCLVDNPRCLIPTPVSDDVLATLTLHTCPFAGFCPGAKNAQPRLAEPRYTGSFY